MYSDKVMDHFTNPRNVGEIEGADGVGEVDNVETLKETVRVRIKDGDIFKQKRYEVKDIKVIKDVKIEENAEEDKIEEEKELFKTLTSF